MNLYGERFMALARSARGRTEPGDAAATGSAANRMCGDEITVALELEGGVIRAATYRERGCAVVTVSAALLTQVVAGKTGTEARELADRLERSLADPLGSLPDGLDELSVARMFPTRRRCALLPWEALRRALDGAASGA